MIKNIVIGSGGNDLFVYTGVIDKLIKTEYVKIDNLENLYGTSAGAMILLIFAAKAKWEEFVEYITKKPWDRYWENSTTRGLLNIYNNKGVADINMMEDALIPILKSVGLKRTVTFEELYKHSGIKYNVFVFNFNKFTSECFNYETTPELEVIKGIYMSCSFPLLFAPLYYNDTYYLDGGIHVDCPIDECLENNKNKNETICIRKKCPTQVMNIKLLKDTSVLDFAMLFVRKLISQNRKKPVCDFENTIIVTGYELLLNDLLKLLSEKEKRIEKIGEGRELADKYLTEKLKVELKNSINEFS